MRLHNYGSIEKTLQAAIEIEEGLKEDKINKSRGYVSSWNNNKERGAFSSNWQKNKGPMQEAKKPFVKNAQVEKQVDKNLRSLLQKKEVRKLLFNALNIMASVIEQASALIVERLF